MPSVKLTIPFIRSVAIPERDPIEHRDTEQKGLLLKVTPAGAKVFMCAYRTKAGVKRKPRIGLFGAITLDEARSVARQIMARVALGEDPSTEQQQERKGLTVRDLCTRFLSDYGEARYKPSTLTQVRRMIDKRIVPALSSMKISAVRRADIAELHTRLRSLGKKKGVEANRVLATLRKMFNEAEAWGLRDENTNPCRLLKLYPERPRDRLLTNDEVRRIYQVLDRADRDGSEPQCFTLAIRLMFALCARASEIAGLQWKFVKPEHGVIRWPDSKGNVALEKPLTEEIATLLAAAEGHRVVGNPHVCVAPHDRTAAITVHTMGSAWKRILVAARIPHCGTHAIRHRATTDIANDPTVPLHVGMRLTGHRTVVTFMRYVHTQRDQARDAAEAISARRRTMVDAKPDVTKSIEGRSTTSILTVRQSQHPPVTRSAAPPQARRA